MSSELFRRARRAEAGAARVEDRRRLRLEFFRAVLAEGLDSLKAMHAEGASGEESVRAHARLIDAVVQSLTRLVVDDAERDGLAPVAAGGGRAGRVRSRRAAPLVGHRPDGGLRRRADAVRAAGHAGAAVRAVGSGVSRSATASARSTTAWPWRGPTFRAARRCRRPGSSPATGRLFTRFRRVLRENVYRRDFGQFLETTLGRARSALPASSAALALHRRAKRQGVGRRACATCTPPCGWARPSSAPARCASWPTRGSSRPRAGGDRRGADLSLARAQRAALLLRATRTTCSGATCSRGSPRTWATRTTTTTLGVERFMRDYYLHARVIHRVSRRLIARCQETLSRRGSAERPASASRPGRRPRLLRRPAAPRRPRSRRAARRADAAHEGILALHRRAASCRSIWSAPWRTRSTRSTTRSAIAGGARSVPRHLPDVGAGGADVLGDARAGAARPLPAGVRRADVPGAVRRLSQVLGRPALAARGASTWRRWRPGQSAESEGAAQVFNEVEKPELLMLGMLLHDVGKAKGHGHVAKGIPLVRELVTRDRTAARRRLGGGVPRRPPPHDVAHRAAPRHRRPQDDRGLRGDRWATPSVCKMLYLLTCADMRAVGPGVLTPWQASILHELYRRTLARLTGGRDEQPQPHAARRAAARRSSATSVPPQAVKAHVAMVSDRYVATTSVQRMAEHLRMFARLDDVAGRHRAVPPPRPRHVRPASSSPATCRGSSR